MAVCAISQPAPGGEPDQPAATTGSTKIIRFMPNWTNTNAVFIYNGTETIMSAVKNYCGWFETKVKNVPATNFTVRFKQTIGNTYVGAEGNEEVTLFIFKCYNGMAVYKIGSNIFGDDPQPGKPGDVNGDGEVNIADVNAVLDMILTTKTLPSGDVNGDSEVNIADVNALIDMILNA